MSNKCLSKTDRLSVYRVVSSDIRMGGGLAHDSRQVREMTNIDIKTLKRGIFDGGSPHPIPPYPCLGKLKLQKKAFTDKEVVWMVVRLPGAVPKPIN